MATEMQPPSAEPPMFEEIPLEVYRDEPAARANGHPVEAEGEAPVTLTDFYAYMPTHQYVFVPSRELWPAASVNTRISPIHTGPKKYTKASEWLDQNRAVEQMTWSPGMPMVIENRLVSGGGWIERPGCRTFNLYQPPSPPQGDPEKGGPWLSHVQRVFPEGAEHIIRWLAHRVQRPGEKVNHAIVLGGAQGIGKDTLLEPVKHAVGSWNVAEVGPLQLMGRFNGFLKSVIVRVSEARDQGEPGGGRTDRYAVYEHCKTLTAAPPDVLRVDEKNLREYSILNVCGLVFTTNHRDGIYLPADDRRHFVAWSDLTKEDFTEAYWRELYQWYSAGGSGHVAAYLSALDLSSFNPKASPPKTAAFHRMVDAGRAPEDAELADVLDTLGNRAAVTLADLAIYAPDGFREWLQDRRNRRQIPHRLEVAGYSPVRNDMANDGLWKISGRRQAVYARRDLPERDRIAAASKLAREGGR